MRKKEIKEYQDISEYIVEKLETDSEIRKEYDELEFDFQVINEIIRVRKELNLTQEELSKKTGISQSILSRLERGNFNPTLSFLNRIAKGLNKKIYITIK